MARYCIEGSFGELREVSEESAIESVVFKSILRNLLLHFRKEEEKKVARAK